MNINDFNTEEDHSKPKCYVLDMFPYPSGEGLHMGHVKVYTASDIYARYKRMKGYNVLHPTGFDAFGLPAEQFALKNKIHPRVSTDKNIATYLKQMQALEFSYDYEKVIDTTDQAFYKWTQWIFKQIYKKGLAYESYEPINWCPSCKTGLANEDLEGNACERCGTIVEKKPLRQWVLKITDYADRLIDDLDTLSGWPQSFIDLEKNWIGRSEGAEFEFKLTDVKDHTDGQMSVKVFTTRPDTIYGATFVAISAETAKSWFDAGWETNAEVLPYVAEVLEEQKKVKDYSVVPDKTGVFAGVYAINPATNEKIPVWVANYVVGGVGTGAIMCVPGHDERDYAFAKKYNLPSIEVVRPYVIDHVNTPREDKATKVRRNVHAIVYDPKNKKYLIIRNSIHTWDTIVIGGVEEREDLLEAAKRELAEKTGYTDIIYKRTLGNPVQAEYFAPHKDENRLAITSALYFELGSDTRVPIATDGDNAGNEIMWVSEAEFVPGKMINSELSFWLARLKNPEEEVYTGSGILVNSGDFNGLTTDDAKIKITEAFEGSLVKQYKLKDWVFSRQRYWGEPFPIVFDENHKSYVVADSELPVKLPDVKEYEPTGTGESPLATIKEWVDVYGYINEDNEFVSCDKGDLRAKLFTRETNTMPQWAGSSWYYLRFIDVHNEKEMLAKDLEKYWQPVDVYVGGAEHATRHLIYARFWHKFLYDIGIVSSIEPFTRLESVGLILGEGGVKMSKRLGNVINPDDVIKEYGSDVARMYVMFMGPFGQSSAWDSKSIQGVKKFLDRVKRLREKVGESVDDRVILNQSIKKISEDIEDFKFNTAISQLMILLNHYEAVGSLSDASFRIFLVLLSPFAPHLTEQIWSELGNTSSIHTEHWPVYDEALIIDEIVTYALQINGKLRGTVTLSRTLGEVEVLDAVKELPGYKQYVGENTPIKQVFVPGKLINIVI